MGSSGATYIGSIRANAEVRQARHRSAAGLALAANVFYLTLPFYYFYVFAALALAIPAVFGPRYLSTSS